MNYPAECCCPVEIAKMRRPRKFFILILILLIINALFFSFWYAFGGRNWVRNMLTDAVGKMIDAEISMGDLHFSDKQIYAQDIKFATADSLISLTVENVRIRYNLYKLIFSGFKPQGVVGSIEIVQPQAIISYKKLETQDAKPRNRKPEFKIPDLSGYFRKISLVDGSIAADVAIPLKIVKQGELYIEESLSDINLIVHNTNVTELTLKANTSRGGRLDLSGRLVNGRIDLAEAEIADFKPLYLTHPDIQDFRSEINLTASYHEPADSSAAQYAGKALIWNSSALLLDEYKVNIPLISAEAEDGNLSARITRSRIGSSVLEAELRIQDLGKNMSFDGSSLSANLDLGMILPQLSGMVTATAQASGNIKDARVHLSAASPRVAYDQWVINDVAIDALYEDDIATLKLEDAIWENQVLALSAEFDPRLMGIKANVDTYPVRKEGVPYHATGSIEIEGFILRPFPMFEAHLKDVSLAYQDAALDSVNGFVRMIPLNEALLVDAQIDAGESFSISVIGDVMQQHLLLDADFKDVEAAGFYPNETLQRFKPLVGGKIEAMMLGNKVWTKSDVSVRFQEELPLVSNLSILGHADLKAQTANVFIRSFDSFFNEQPLDFELSANYAEAQITVHALSVNDFVNLSGRVNLKDWQDMDFDIAIRDLTTAKLSGYYPDLELMVPEFAGLSLFAKYNRAGIGNLDVWLNIRQVDLLSVVPLDVDLRLNGLLDEISISGDVKTHGRELLGLIGTGSLLPKINLALEATMRDLRMQDVLTQAPAEGSISGVASVILRDALSEDRDIEFAADITAEAIRFGEFAINKVVLKAAQQAQALVVDSLYVISDDLFTATAKGSLGFNIVKNEFFDAQHSLEVDVQGQLFPWLKELTDYIVDSHGVSNIKLSIGNDDEQFVVHSGELDIHNGYIMLKDQVEALRNIEINGVFEENRFILHRGQFNMGNGRFYMNNVFDADPSDHFVLGFMDMGYLRLMIEKPGIQATIPVVSPPKTLSNIALKGQNSRYATIRGPFDDMKIEAYVTASNLDILFPPGADNLLNLILSVRSSGKKPDSDPIPLPFQMDLFVSIGENVRYVTYPTNLNLKPGGFLHLLYDGNAFIVKEIFINSERGTVDFFGTVFEVDNIAISMIDQQDIMNVEGLFYKRTPDGSTVSLTVHSTPEFDKNLLDRLEITLTSDNPADRNITQVLSRLRYNQSMDELPADQKQTLLQDEALGLIGGNLNSTVLTPFLYPVENWVRRTLKLDSFSIHAGFIQNLFTEYSSDPSQLADMADMSHFGSDISRFSSSILLNNLSVSMSKYLGYRFFVDYEFGLQEATDLQKKTRILVSHDTSLRLVLPKQYRVDYTFRYKPGDTGITHEIMVQRTLRFWGL